MGAGFPPGFSIYTDADLLAVADFNGDGKLDLITYGNGRTSVWLGDGTGGFGQPQTVPFFNFGSPIGSIVAGDFNGDGNMDVAAVTITDNGILSVSTGDGTGKFQPAFNEYGSSYSLSPLAATGDFTNSGKSDVLAFSPYGRLESLTWSFTGNTSSTLSSSIPKPSLVSSIPTFVAVADFNGDGKLDWAGVSPGLGAVIVCLGDGTGAFTTAPGSPYTIGGAPIGIAAGDFNNDGKIDLAVDTGSSVVLLLNSGTQTPAITANGIVPAYSTATTVQPGEWISIYGTNLANTTASWHGEFPLTLGGTNVTIDGRSAYLSYVSPTQINLQTPDDTATGTVPVVVTTPTGNAASTTTLGEFGPSFILLDSKHVAGIIPRTNGFGAYGHGPNSYDIIGPSGTSLGYPTVAAKAGDTIELFGVGFGPTLQVVPAGQAFSGATQTTNPVTLMINNVIAPALFAGLASEAGLYQFNLTVPGGLGTGDVPLEASVGGVETQSYVVLALQ